MEPSDLINSGSDQPPEPDVLRSIVERAGRRRWRSVVAGVTAAVVAGAGIGYAVSRTGTKTQTVVSASPHTGSQPSAALGPVVSSGGVSAASPIGVTSPTYAPAFSRTADGVTIRAYTLTWPTTGASPTGPAGASCRFVPNAPELTAEISTKNIVATDTSSGGVSTGDSAPLLSAQGFLEGTAEHDPTYVVIVQVGKGVTAVKATFASGAGTDEMGPVDGFAVLAGQPTSASPQTTLLGTLEALNAKGSVMKSIQINTDAYFGYYEPNATNVFPPSTVVSTSPTSVTPPLAGSPTTTVIASPGASSTGSSVTTLPGQIPPTATNGSAGQATQSGSGWASSNGESGFSEEIGSGVLTCTCPAESTTTVSPGSAGSSPIPISPACGGGAVSLGGSSSGSSSVSVATVPNGPLPSGSTSSGSTSSGSVSSGSVSGSAGLVAPGIPTPGTPTNSSTGSGN